MHQANVSEVRVGSRCVAGAKGIVGASLTVPAGLVVEPAEKSVGVRADVKSEGPDASPRLRSVGVSYSVKGIVCVTDTEVGVYGIKLLKVINRRAREHRNMSEMGVSAHRPKLAVGIAVHGGRAVLANTVSLGEGGILGISYLKGVFIKKIVHKISPQMTFFLF